jgi:DNA-binding SARP family transcriptional activator/DNA polymerase III delta prime subunit
MRFEVLGPLRIRTDQGDVAITARRERVLVALLLLQADRAVPVDQLVEALWSDRPPHSARNQIQACVSQLRRRLTDAGAPGDVIVTEPIGYRLRVDLRQVDVHEFRALLREARAAVAAGRYSEARDGYRAAVELWRGPVLAGIDSVEVARTAAALDEEHAQALQERIEVELRLGGAGELVAELTDLVQRYPYREGLQAALMRALYRAGRQADALAAFRQARRLLRDELGAEPGEELQRLHHAILNRTADLETGAVAAISDPVRALPVPRELPLDASCFVSRQEEIVQIRDALTPTRHAAGHRPALVVLYGPGGVGKSALAVRAAHELVGEFPDGQLYVDMCGSTPGMRPLSPMEVLARFLRRLGVVPEQVPPDPTEAAALFRSAIAERRLLLVLDNAADSGQVAPLLPGTGTCAVLVTSRLPLSSLDVDHRLRLGVLPAADGLALLRGLTGDLDPEAAKRIVTLSDGLPLAIRIAAGRLACRPDLPAAEYAARLADRSRRLDELQLDDLAVRASIRTSYDALLSDGDRIGSLAARAFRMLGLLHAPDVGSGVIAAMLAQPVQDVRAALDRLIDAQLVEPVGAERCGLHDLVRLVAAEQARADATPDDRERALARAVAYYTGALWRAEVTLSPTRNRPYGDPRLPPDVPLPSFGSPAEARTWIDDELPSLVGVLEQAAGSGAAVRYLTWLSHALWTVLDMRCEWPTAYRMSQLVLDAAKERGDRELMACGLLLHGRSEACLGNYQVAATHLERALGIARDLESHLSVVLVLNGLGIVEVRRGEPAAALAYYREALDLARRHGWTNLTAVVLNNMSASYARLEQLDRADAAVAEAAAIVGVEDHAIRATTVMNLAAIHCIRGDGPTAARYADEALRLSRETGDRVRQCEALVVRSQANRRGGRLLDAASDADAALTLARASGYRFMVAAAQHQRAAILAALGREPEAADARSRADEAYAQLRGTFRDGMIALVLAHDRPSWRGHPVTRRLPSPEPAVDGALDDGRDPAGRLRSGSLLGRGRHPGPQLGQ